MEYSKLLQTDDWEIKCRNILQRDNYVCQDCGAMGIHNNSFFPISRISDLDIFFPNDLFDGRDLSTVCNNVQWRGNYDNAHICLYNSKRLEEDLYIHMMHVYGLGNEFYFATDTKVDKLHLVGVRNNINMLHNAQQIDGYLFAFNFKENLGQSNYAQIKYSLHTNNILLEELEINIFCENKSFHFTFCSANYKNNEPIFKFIPLHIHHNYYILGKKPWEYDDKALVTLCSKCHQNRHLKEQIPIYKDSKSKFYLPLCDRCHGTGYLSQYSYYMGGICFKCQGEGVCGYEK